MRRRTHERVQKITHSQYSPAILDAIFDRPIFQTHDFIERSGIPKPTATTAIRKLKEAEILFKFEAKVAEEGQCWPFEIC